MTKQHLNTTAPSRLKLAASLLYELLTVSAIIFLSTGIFIFIVGDAGYGIKRLFLQLFLWLVVGAYFIRCWLISGQTLAMQAWKLRLLNEQSQLLTIQSAIARYLLATLSITFFGIGFLWAIVDKNNLFLHDRFLRCKIIAEVN